MEVTKNPLFSGTVTVSLVMGAMQPRLLGPLQLLGRIQQAMVFLMFHMGLVVGQGSRELLCMFTYMAQQPGSTTCPSQPYFLVIYSTRAQYMKDEASVPRKRTD